MKKLFSVIIITLMFSAVSNYSNAVNEYRLDGAGPATFYNSLQAVLTAANSTTNGTGAKTITVIGIPPLEAASSTLTGANYTSLIFTVSAFAITISCSAAAAILILDNADNVTINGTVNGGTLTFTNISAASTAGCIQLSNGSSNNLIKNCTFNGLGTGTTVGGRVINIAQSTLDIQGGNNNNIIENNIVNGGRRGIQVFGTAPAGAELGVTNNGTIIRKNIVKNASSLAIFIGSETRDNTVLENEIFMDAPVSVGAALNFRGINCQGVGTNEIRKNKIYNLTSTDITATYFGILLIPVTLTAPGFNLTVDNVINNCVTLMTDNSGFVEGVTVSFIAQAYTANILNNTIRLAGNSVDPTNALDIANTFSGSTINVFSNIAINGKTGGSQNIALDLTLFPNVVNLNAEYNTVKGLDAVTGWDAGFNSCLYGDPLVGGCGTLAAYKFATAPFSIEQSTAFMNVLFSGLNTCDFSLFVILIGGDMCGIPSPLVQDDINGTPRNPNYPYKGAFEGQTFNVLSATLCLEGKVSEGEITVSLYNAACVLIASGTAYNNVITGKTDICFGNAVTYGTGYRLKVKSINHLETWSALPNIVFTAGGPPNATYDFTTSPAKAFGSNQTPGPPSCMFGGDVNHDNTIDVTDLGEIDNDGYNFVSGNRIPTDINSDGTVDVTDAAIADNNAFNFVSVQSPCLEPTSIISNQPQEVKKLQTSDNRNVIIEVQN